MPYRFATVDWDYSDYASGRVLYHLPGEPAFPVRLASEIFQRAARWLALDRRARLYDPACGGAYHLTALGFLHGEQIQTILASDVDARALELARRNLELLTPDGLGKRESALSAILAEFGKQSHREALSSLSNLRQRLAAAPPIQTRVFQANALDPAALRQQLSDEAVDLVFADVPYGQLSAWQGRDDKSQAGRPPLWQMLEALRPLLSSSSIVAIAADKAQKITHAGYRRVERFQVGKRQVSFLQPL